MNLLLQKKNDRGFTLIEIIAVLVIIGIIAAVAIGSVMSTSETNRISQTSVIKNHIRYAQSTAMKRGTITIPVWGIKCDGAAYWLFRTNAPDTQANQIILPGEDNVQISLANKNITLTAFTVFFDGNGRPYTAYADATTNAPVAAPLVITVGSLPAGSSGAFTIAPETGFIP
jgi:prepilin-type N-terminal cleavage/methylation domain-containing protein